LFTLAGTSKASIRSRSRMHLVCEDLELSHRGRGDVRSPTAAALTELDVLTYPLVASRTLIVRRPRPRADRVPDQHRVRQHR
jgi:hypothetical protein